MRKFLLPVALLVGMSNVSNAGEILRAPIVFIESVVCRAGNCRPNTACHNGRCDTSVYEERNVNTERNRVFGGTVSRKNSRVVVRPTR
jgi:hypothetical protein